MIKNLKINYIANLLDGGFFGFAIGFASFTAIIPLFVSTMTNSALLIGLIPAIHNMGWQLPQLLTANKISKLPRFKPFVMAMTIHERVPFLGLVLVAWFSPVIGNPTALVLTFLMFNLARTGSWIYCKCMAKPDWENFSFRISGDLFWLAIKRRKPSCKHWLGDSRFHFELILIPG